MLLGVTFQPLGSTSPRHIGQRGREAIEQMLTDMALRRKMLLPISTAEAVGKWYAG